MEQRYIDTLCLQFCLALIPFYHQLVDAACLLLDNMVSCDSFTWCFDISTIDQWCLGDCTCKSQAYNIWLVCFPLPNNSSARAHAISSSIGSHENNEVAFKQYGTDIRSWLSPSRSNTFNAPWFCASTARHEQVRHKRHRSRLTIVFHEWAFKPLCTPSSKPHTITRTKNNGWSFVDGGSPRKL